MRSGLPHRYEARGEALTSGSDVLGACAVAGEDLARDGASMQEALEGMRDTWRHCASGDPTYDAVSALVTAWSETTLGYLHQLSCDDPSDEAGDHFTRAMRIARAGELARTVFARDETIARLGRHRVAILCHRDERLGRRVRVLATLLEGSPEGVPVRLWIEGLPGSDHLAGALLDELARG